MAEENQTPPATNVDDDLTAILEQIKQLAAAPAGQSSVGYNSSYYGVPVGYKAKSKASAGIYNLRGELVRDAYYDLNNEPSNILYNQMTDQQRLDLRDTLFAKGYYDSKDKPKSNMITKEDEAAVSKLLLEANWTQTEYKDLLNMVRQRPDEAPTGGQARRFQLSSPDDLKVVANRVAIETLGRRLDDNDLEDFVRLYQRKQMRYQQQESGVVTQPADPETMVMNTLQNKYADETEAYGYMQAVDRLARLVGAY